MKGVELRIRRLVIHDAESFRAETFAENLREEITYRLGRGATADEIAGRLGRGALSLKHVDREMQAGRARPTREGVAALDLARRLVK